MEALDQSLDHVLQRARDHLRPARGDERDHAQEDGDEHGVDHDLELMEEAGPGGVGESPREQPDHVRELLGALLLLAVARRLAGLGLGRGRALGRGQQVGRVRGAAGARRARAAPCRRRPPGARHQHRDRRRGAPAARHQALPERCLQHERRCRLEHDDAEWPGEPRHEPHRREAGEQERPGGEQRDHAPQRDRAAPERARPAPLRTGERHHQQLDQPQVGERPDRPEQKREGEERGAIGRDRQGRHRARPERGAAYARQELESHRPKARDPRVTCAFAAPPLPDNGGR